jgi:hypothetical protein
MPGSFDASNITADEFEKALSRYANYVPDKLKDLDELRFDTIPAELADRRESGNEVSLEKKEVQSLVEWKL